MNSEDVYCFICPVCSESLEVNTPMRNALIENGCVLCCARVASQAFTLATAQ